MNSPFCSNSFYCIKFIKFSHSRKNTFYILASVKKNKKPEVLFIDTGSQKETHFFFFYWYFNEKLIKDCRFLYYIKLQTTHTNTWTNTQTATHAHPKGLIFLNINGNLWNSCDLWWRRTVCGCGAGVSCEYATAVLGEQSEIELYRHEQIFLSVFFFERENERERREANI